MCFCLNFLSIFDQKQVVLNTFLTGIFLVLLLLYLILYIVSKKFHSLLKQFLPIFSKQQNFMHFFEFENKNKMTIRINFFSIFAVGCSILQTAHIFKKVYSYRLCFFSFFLSDVPSFKLRSSSKKFILIGYNPYN